MDANSVGVDPVRMVILVVLWGMILALVAWSHQPRPQGVPVPAKRPRVLKPKTGDDCALCRSSLFPKLEMATGVSTTAMEQHAEPAGTQETCKHGRLWLRQCGLCNLDYAATPRVIA